MKSFLLSALVMLGATNAFSQISTDVTTGTLLSPFVLATKLLETSTVGSMAAVKSTKSAVQSRGVAGKEQLKDELVLLNEAMLHGTLTVIAEVKQPGLRELFEEIQSDEEQMRDIYSIVPSGTELYRIATAVTIALMME